MARQNFPVPVLPGSRRDPSRRGTVACRSADPDLSFPVGDTGLTVTQLTDPVGLRLRGEADLLGAGALRAAIAALPADTGAVRLELAELRFIDVDGTRQLVTLAQRPGRPRLLLHQPPPSLLLLLRLLWPGCRQAPAPDHEDSHGVTVAIHAP